MLHHAGLVADRDHDVAFCKFRHIQTGIVSRRQSGGKFKQRKKNFTATRRLSSETQALPEGSSSGRLPGGKTACPSRKKGLSAEIALYDGPLTGLELRPAW